MRSTDLEQDFTVGEGVHLRVYSSVPPAGDAADKARSFVLVHGIGMTHRSLRRLHERLAPFGTVHSVDLPGAGRLPRPRRTLSIADTAAALGVVLDRMGVESAVLVGHSMGTQWCTDLALQRPGLADAVVAIGPVVDNRHRTLLGQAIALGIDSIGEPPTVNTVVVSDYLRYGPVWYLDQVQHMVDYPMLERVAALEVPVLVLRGSEDPIAGMAWSRRLRDAARAARLVVVPHHRHVVPYTSPRATASAITAFLDAPPARRPT